MTRPKLKMIAATHRPVIVRDDLHAYEYQQRQRLAETDWSKLHTASDKREPVELVDAKRRGWR